LEKAVHPTGKKMQREQFIQTVSEMSGQVWDFHERWRFWPFDGPDRPPSRAIAERQAILDEEITELGEAVKVNDGEEIANEAADVLFVALGHVLSLREPGLAGMHFVTGKNARKTEETHRVRPDTGKLLPISGKPHKWR
jgi:NTP pyrophosphatase (non-canonical NTP hydrolase)